MEEFFPQNENLKTVLCRPSVKKSQNCEIFFWGYYGRIITRAEFTGMKYNGLYRIVILFSGVFSLVSLPNRDRNNNHF